jgi:hypothetical protein
MPDNIFHLYLHFPVNLEKLISTREEGVKFIIDIQMLIDRADCEHGTILYVDNYSRKRFYDELAILQEDCMLGYFGIYDIEEVLNIKLLEANAINWEENSLTNGNIQYSEIKTDQSINSLFPNVLKEICERIFLVKDRFEVEKCLLVNIGNDFISDNPIHLLRTHKRMLTFHYIPFVKCFDELDDWFLANRITRRYNHGDNRHIENHKSYIRGKSPLLGGIAAKTNAEKLLSTALGDQREKSYLINIDDIHECYIRFEYENSQNQYHGYNIVNPISHERSIHEEDKISGRILILLNYRRRKSK